MPVEVGPVTCDPARDVRHEIPTLNLGVNVTVVAIDASRHAAGFECDRRAFDVPTLALGAALVDRRLADKCHLVTVGRSIVIPFETDPSIDKSQRSTNFLGFELGTFKVRVDDEVSARIRWCQALSEIRKERELWKRLRGNAALEAETPGIGLYVAVDETVRCRSLGLIANIIIEPVVAHPPGSFEPFGRLKSE